MSSPTDDHLDRLRSGDAGALNALLTHTERRLRLRAKQMLRGFPEVRRWEETDDVLNKALFRLTRAVRAEPPADARHYYNLAALQIRRELLDMAAHYTGPLGHGANHQTGDSAVAGAVAPSEEPSSVAEWADFHRRVDTLPADQKEVFGLLWYQGKSQEEAATVIRQSVRNVKRLWQKARLALARRPGANPLSA
jgi:RNA polymerase sigma-70 factor (ECF subfamily)